VDIFPKKVTRAGLACPERSCILYEVKGEGNLQLHPGGADPDRVKPCWDTSRTVLAGLAIKRNWSINKKTLAIEGYKVTLSGRNSNYSLPHDFGVKTIIRGNESRRNYLIK